MSKPSWREQLSQTLAYLGNPDRPPRVAVVGIGHELRGDDAAGVIVARALQALPPVGDRLLVIDAGVAPENQTGPLRRFGPDLVLLIDAAQMDEPPGAVRWLPWQAAVGLSASTHTQPLSILAAYLTADLGCEVALLGIQPAGTAIGAPLSAAVGEATRSVIEVLGG